jgi:hypothetical protein
MEVHGLMVEKAKPRRLATFKGGPQHQNHTKINIHILGDAMVMQRHNDQMVASRACAKVQHECDKPMIVAQQCPPLPKPTLVKLVLE